MCEWGRGWVGDGGGIVWYYVGALLWCVNFVFLCLFLHSGVVRN